MPQALLATKIMESGGRKEGAEECKGGRESDTAKRNVRRRMGGNMVGKR